MTDEINNIENDEENLKTSNLKSKFNFNKKMFVKIVACLIAAIFIFEISASLILTNAFLGKNNLKNSAKAQKIISVPLSQKEDIKWLTETALKTSLKGDGKNELTALEIKNRSITNSYVIICHPITGDSSSLASHAHHFYDLGFNIIMPDARGCGRNKSKKISLGYPESEDILKWIDYILSENKNSNIFLFGVGMGASTVLLASDKGLPKNVKGIISDSAYSDLNEVFKNNVKRFYKLSKFPTINIASLYNKAVNGFFFGEINVRDHVKNSDIPTLFIHSVEDSIVPIGQSNDLFEVSKSQKSEHYRVPGATHCQGINKNTEKYWQNIDKFIISNLEF